MTMREHVLAELDRLIQEGNSAAQSYRLHTYDYVSDWPEPRLTSFRTGAAAAIERIAGRDSEYFSHLPPVVAPGQLRYHRDVAEGTVGVVMALRDAVDRDLLVRLEQRVRSNTYDDFLTQAEELLKPSPGYVVAAMVLIGGVLEDRLRTMCVARGLPWKGKDGLSAYNDALKEVVYPQAVWRRIQGVGDNRNSAAHGGERAAGLKQDDVEDDLRWVRKFLAE